MSARSRAKPWFRDERWERLERQPWNWIGHGSPFDRPLDLFQNSSSYDLWKRPAGDPVADMRTAIEKLERMR